MHSGFQKKRSSGLMTSTGLFLLISSRIVYLYIHLIWRFLDNSSSAGGEPFFFI